MWVMKQSACAVTILLCSGLGLGLSACDSQQPPHEQLMSNEIPDASAQAPQSTSSHETIEGRKLTDVAGQATLPKQNLSNRVVTDQLNAYELQFVGRYHTEMACEDSFVDCKQGNAEYILNLLPDGTAHRIVMHYGKVYSENDAQQKHRYYRVATWEVNRAEQELVVYPQDGNPIYYDIQSRDRLVMNLTKIRSAARAHPQNVSERPLFIPSKAYVLLKDVDEATS